MNINNYLNNTVQVTRQAKNEIGKYNSDTPQTFIVPCRIQKENSSTFKNGQRAMADVKLFFKPNEDIQVGDSVVIGNRTFSIVTVSEMMGLNSITHLEATTEMTGN